MFMLFSVVNKVIVITEPVTKFNMVRSYINIESLVKADRTGQTSARLKVRNCTLFSSARLK